MLTDFIGNEYVPKTFLFALIVVVNNPPVMPSIAATEKELTEVKLLG